jgi:hypothetical protein
MHIYEIRPRKDHRGVELISDVLPLFVGLFILLRLIAGVDSTVPLAGQI